ncbi:diguanylate cyclase (GGDEF)-like protein [Paenibacillus cellulosilyticus]|uniref:Diguanylate cyclase (GGDEF)-like protein n=1 Tax=Paenibacillus cellulosilyticus TaxID=375489 RepID=A0A2V2YXN5_9BACL|nr:EAL domain-containing protein [Paenibacillus cellulosilyticus]PWW02920.1 diguanylate cyclase (GGDEF)-like protein [Paenibacillus cellulosilyticus]QKS45828.1 EAL domain-containing protein [Paenibacillus cellulosilyticus]
MKYRQRWIKRLIHHAPNAVIILSALSLSLNMMDSVTSSRGHVFALLFAGFIFTSIVIKPLRMKYVLAAAAFIAFFNAIPELSFDKLVSVMYLTLVLLAFLLPSPIPTILAAAFYLMYMHAYLPAEPIELVNSMMIGVIINTILYSLLAFYFRNMKKENELNAKLNVQLNEALGELEHMAYYDMLTALPNRALLKERMIAELSKETPLAVLFLDLDYFKNVNDMTGHNGGDQMLKDVANQLSSVVGGDCFISRYAGDEFIVVFPYERHEEVDALAQKLIHSFRTPFQLNQKQIYTTLSIGISQYPKDACEVESLILCADKAMYEVKRSGKNGYRFFSAIQSEQLLRQVKLENDLRSALSRQELSLYYQPIVEMHTGTIRGVEALLRWTHPEFGPIAPSVFVPLAEQTGIIIEIGEWVLEEACRQVRSWQLAGNPELTVAVNISIRQFNNAGFTTTVNRILKETGFDAALLELEVTESMMQNLNESMSILDELKRLGVKISIDDFGTGYSSLSVLRHLPVDYLKIDRSFTQELTTDTAAESIIKLIIDIGHTLNLEIICEGIEKEEELELLQQYGCRIGQGYYFYRPVSSEEMGLLLHRGTPA